MKKILVTGGAGFIGSHLTKGLLKAGYGVTVLDNLSTGYLENIPSGAVFVQGDIRDEQTFTGLGNGYDAVLHLAAQSSGELSFNDPLGDFNSHALGTFRLLSWCHGKGIKRFLYASSMATYGDARYLPVDEKHPQNPKSYYAAGKMAAEAYVRLFSSFGMETTVFRLFSIYGPGQNMANQAQGIVSIYLSYMLAAQPVVVKGSLDRFRDLLYIDDLCGAWLAALEDARTHGKTYNLCNGSKTTVAELLDGLRAAFGAPAYPVEAGVATSGDQHGLYGNCSAIAGDIGWKPKTPLSEGLAAMVEFEKQRFTKRGNT